MLELPCLLLVSSIAVSNGASSQAADSIHSTLLTVDIRTGRVDTVYAAARHFEAPNWSRDGSFFVVNSGGKLYRVRARGGRTLAEIPTGFATRLNNDHGLSPDGRRLAISHAAQEHIADPSQSWLASSIYLMPVTGSAAPVKITTRAPSFWHGWSPDGTTLAFVGRRESEWDIYDIPAAGGAERRLTTCRGLDDGPDYAPDGTFIYYNSFCSGKMEIWRMRADGSHPEQLTRDAYSNWFPHPSPDGRWVAYIAYLEDQGDAHPFGKQVKLRLMDRRDGTVRDLTPPFFGGQGTLNVPSWSPDSRRVAFVAYGVRNRPAAQSPADTSLRAEAAVQTTVLDSLFVRDTSREVVVLDSTVSGGSHFVDEDYRSALRMLGALPSGLQANFEAVRDKRRAIGSLPTRVPLVRLDPAERTRMRQSPDTRSYWAAFYRRHPGSAGQIALSRPGFSRDGRSALMLVEYECGGLCGGTLYLLLERIKGRWRIVRVAQPREA